MTGSIHMLHFRKIYIYICDMDLFGLWVGGVRQKVIILVVLMVSFQNSVRNYEKYLIEFSLRLVFEN